MTDYLPGYDAWLSREPEHAEWPGPDEEEEEIEAPEVEEIWHPTRMEYVTTVTFASGNKFTIVQAHAGPFVGDWEIHGPGYFADGYLDPQDAIERLCDPERRDW